MHVNDEERIKHIREAALEACEMIRDETRQNLDTDRKLSLALVRLLEIIGEAAGRLPEDFTNQHAEIEWVKIIGLRNRIVHEYFGVDLQIIWQVLKKDIPAFKAYLKNIRSQSDD